MSDKRAIVVGHQGQDGRLLCELLRRRGYTIAGIGRSCVDYIPPNRATLQCSLTDAAAVEAVVTSFCPHEIYYLAAYHRSADSPVPSPAVDWHLSYEVNALGVLHFLEAIRKLSPAPRLFYASSSHIYGSCPRESPQTELTPPSPSDPYGASKLLGGQMCEYYRAKHGVFASVGILYNHESALRREDFLSAKLIRAALSAKRGDSISLRIGDLDARVDWGYAPDFVDAFTRVMSLAEPDTYLFATGETHTVRDFAHAAFSHLGLEWSHYIRQEPSVLTRASAARVGNPAKLMNHTGWHPTLRFREMVASIVDDLRDTTVAPLCYSPPQSSPAPSEPH